MADKRSATGWRSSAPCRAGRANCWPTSRWRSGLPAARRCGCTRDDHLLRAQQGADGGGPRPRDEGPPHRGRPRRSRADGGRARRAEGRRHHGSLSPGRQSVPDPARVQASLPDLTVRFPATGNPHFDKEVSVAKFKVVTPAGTNYGALGASYDFELEGLAPIGAEIVEIPAGTEDEFVQAARDADALYAKGRAITKRMIDGLERCKVIALGSVGVDSVDVAAATARHIPVTNVPDTFIEEVADHAMMLILATFRRLVVQDRMVREGRWKEGRPALLQIPRLMGQTLGVIAFGHVPR